MSIYLRSGSKGLETFGILISSKFYLNTNSSPAPLRGIQTYVLRDFFILNSIPYNFYL